MSGTSLDGVDLVCCEFGQFDSKFQFEVLCAETIEYPYSWHEILSSLMNQSDSTIKVADKFYAEFLAEEILHFCKRQNIEPNLISSHGHTIKHRPDEGISLQIGNGELLRLMTRIPVVCNFREQDVFLGGQGAPLVPLGDRLLFEQYDYCLNLGGFSNISMEINQERIAFDISPCNLLLNSLSEQLNFKFDKNGLAAKRGKNIQDLLEKWNALAYFKQSFPKSLGREWFELNYSEDINNKEYLVEDKLRTAVDHIVFQISNVIHTMNYGNNQSVLVTGGGAHNLFLIESLQSCLKNNIHLIIPDQRLIDFKEAIIFAFLGYLRILGLNNVLRSVTGAETDHCSGNIYW
ncbi:MAG: anhydro-N-acetylmuramic acid kinase [Saprospiraceae bacterium]|nr:anhydro-N-acetylmuramic acid kinase [Saprospiraceae bacterium]